jgi:hypothetical protein
VLICPPDSPLSQFHDFRPQPDAPVPTGRAARQDFLNAADAEAAAQLRAEFSLQEAVITKARAAQALIQTKLVNLQAADTRNRQEAGGAVATVGYEPDDPGFAAEKARYDAEVAADPFYDNSDND